jgi:hypothetical protein
LFSSSFFFSFFTISSALKKKFHKRFIFLQSISLSYKEKESKIKKKIQKKIQKSEKTMTTSFNNSSVSTTTDLSKIRKKTTNEEISRMNQIIKQNLQKILNVVIATNIATTTTIISSQVSTFSSRTILEQFTSVKSRLTKR